ncbi:hypothetical protein [Acetobacter okinawensis]|uniref:Uncharacterized protein n=1 Tax=Acetobacter okinawensis TaxID=1076594 RepID=A0A252BUB1_9PROT|nr:hypothetical protein [Acetobacter okinawensis]MBS0967176.1 hypothetical protein [Acetobacter okinawensis]MBS0989561.1 hypothetical protein [Acetobacter okinawensis]MCP1212576.1 hypothetical protein [Acetobacter okinawensis]OUJ12496.1 hypothetical protein HK26_02115 [Acetobacter okinawensis]
MQFDPRDISTYPIVRVLCIVLGAGLMLYCLDFYLALPQDTPEHVMRRMAALIVGTILLLGSIWI